MTDDSDDIHDLAVTDEDAGTRLDRFVASGIAGLSRSRVQALIKAGHVAVAGVAVTDVGHKVKVADRVTVAVPPPEAAEPQPEEIALAVTYEDRDVVVIDKPAGLVVHPAAGHAQGTLVNALIAHCGDSLSGIGGVKRPGIVHRLDKDTSGLLVVAKSDAAHRSLSEQFAAHGEDGRLQRTYLALVWGALTRPRGAIDAPLGRAAHNRTKMAVVPEAAGRRAVTHYEVLEVFRDAAGAPLASLLRLQLETGRTHQIRVHLAHIGHPVLGDPVYGTGFKTRASRLSEAGQTALAALGRQALHAAELGFAHPRTGKALLFSSAVPDDMGRLIAALKGAPPPRAAGKAARGRRDKAAATGEA